LLQLGDGVFFERFKPLEHLLHNNILVLSSGGTGNVPLPLLMPPPLNDDGSVPRHKPYKPVHFESKTVTLGFVGNLRDASRGSREAGPMGRGRGGVRSRMVEVVQAKAMLVTVDRPPHV
jgi:hypothetical protein